ncbi:MAG: GerMN domain-containing protein [Spirochaetes bacterium]|nr:GerMN domain-containing protein [Spirochaetota bacterium]
MARSRRGCGVWLLFWIIIFLTLLILLVSNREKIKDRKWTKTFSNFIQKKMPGHDKKADAIPSETIRVTLYFVKYIESKDKLQLVSVPRDLKTGGTPLEDTLDLLLKGPTQKEEANGISSVFPANVKVKGVSVKNGTAYIDFNSEVESGVGIPMLQARLYQIVYTATQFPTVDRVKILINGDAKKTFSTEGLSIKHPLTRLKESPIF